MAVLHYIRLTTERTTFQPEKTLVHSFCFHQRMSCEDVRLLKFIPIDYKLLNLGIN